MLSDGVIRTPWVLVTMLVPGGTWLAGLRLSRKPSALPFPLSTTSETWGPQCLESADSPCPAAGRE